MRSEFYVLLQALVAILLGGVLGWERQEAGKWVGARTHMLVCLAAMLFVRVAEFIIASMESHFAAGVIRADPVRTIEAVATGIAFIGAGTIMRDRQKGRAKGLTSAAELLVTTAIGLAVAANCYVIAFGVVLIALFVLRSVRWAEQKAEREARENALGADISAIKKGL